MIHNWIIKSNEDWKYITEKWLKESSTKEIPANSPLVALTWATCANVALLKFKATANQSVIWLDVNSKNLPEFIYFSYLANREQFLFYQTWWAQWWINLDDVKNIFLAIPSFSLQATIANFLDAKNERISTLISNKKKLIELLKEQKQSIIHSAVTKGIDPNVKMKDVGIPWIGEIPEDWELTPVKHICKQIIDCKNRTPEYFLDWKYLVCRTTDVKSGIIDYDNMLRTDNYNFLEWIKKWRPEVWDILFTREAPAGEAGLFSDSSLEVCLWQRMMLLRPDQNKVMPEWILYTIYSDVIWEYISQWASGSTVKHLRVWQVYNLPIVLPPYSTQVSIINYLINFTSQIDAAIIKIEKEITLIEEYQISLIYQAVTGKISIS